jgi:hypothetical protein
MNPDIATRLAAIVGEGVSVAQTDAIIREFLTQIVRCPTCDDTGTIVIGHDVSIPTKDRLGQAVADPLIEAGTVAPCPYCGGLDNRGRPQHDPEFSAWHCFAGLAALDCRGRKEDPSGIDETHAACGYRIILPLRLPPLKSEQ